MSKIVEVRASAHSTPFSGVFVRLGLGVNTERDCVVVRIIDDEGRVGWGEAHHGQNPTAMAEIVYRGLGSLLKGADVLDSEGIWAQLARQQIATHGLGAGSVMALSGIDIALWDLKGKIMGQPVYRLLGGAPKRIRAYAGGLSLGFKRPEALEADVRTLVDAGYTAIKLRVGDHPRRDAERVGHIRKAFGDGPDIAVDAAAAGWHLFAAPHRSHTVISAAANVHLLCALSNALVFEAAVGEINPFRTELAGAAYQVADGHIVSPDKPSLGLDIDQSVLDRHPAIAGPCYIPGG